jgi:cytochrome c oxidase subunit 2
LSATPKPARHSGARLAVTAALTALLTAGCDAREVYEDAFSLGLPKPITEQADVIYDTWLGSVAAALAVGVFVWALIFYAVVRYRKNSDELPRQVRYNLPIEVLYTVVPFVIIAVLFYYTAVNENFVNNTKKKPDLVVNIVGFQWNWQFAYPKDKVQITGSPTQPAVMVLPTDRRIRFIESSPDVIHSWWVPAFLFKRDVIPGRLNSFEVKLKKDAAGHTYIGRCTEYCGEKHSRMNFYVKVVTPTEFDQYLTELKNDPDAAVGDVGGGSAVPTGDQGLLKDETGSEEK